MFQHLRMDRVHHQQCMTWDWLHLVVSVQNIVLHFLTVRKVSLLVILHKRHLSIDPIKFDSFSLLTQFLGRVHNYFRSSQLFVLWGPGHTISESCRIIKSAKRLVKQFKQLPTKIAFPHSIFLHSQSICAVAIAFQ